MDERGGRKKICVLQILRDDLIDWFNNNLHHPGEDGTQITIEQHIEWPRMSKMIDAAGKACNQCQRNKITGSKNYGNVPPTDDKGLPPCGTMQVDLAGQWILNFKLIDSGKILTK